MINMLDDDNWKFMNNSASRWCRVIVENKMSSCCSNAEFAKGKADNCPDCIADCMHDHFISFCNKYFGKACLVKRKPFHQNGVSLTVHESFCIPEDCDNSEDLSRSAIMKWYAWHYRARRYHWMADYDEAEIECPNNVALIVFSVLGGFALVLAAIPVGLFLFRAPKERGRTLVSQQDMNEDSQVEPIGADATLRSAAFGSDAALGDIGNDAPYAAFDSTAGTGGFN